MVTAREVSCITSVAYVVAKVDALFMSVRSYLHNSQE